MEKYIQYGCGYKVGNLSIWTALIEDEIVPVELINFSANIFGNNVELNWETSTETNNHGFIIERKKNDADNNELERNRFC